MTIDPGPSTILIAGATGQLGSDLVEVFGDDYLIFPTSRADFNITNFKATFNFIKDNKPDVIIHAAAFTDVDGCEDQLDKAFSVNSLGTRNIAIAAREIDAKFFYISTDYVFDGAKEEPYLEFDQPNPINVYGRSKLWGELFVTEQLNKFFIIRTSWLYGQKGKNFVKTMLKLAQEKEELQVVKDQRGTPTYTKDLARQIKKLTPTELYGTYHCTSQGSCTWYEFALEIFEQAGLKIKVNPVTSRELQRLARRPQNSVLENYLLKLQNLDIMPHWKNSLKNFMKGSNFELT